MYLNLDTVVSHLRVLAIATHLGHLLHARLLHLGHLLHAGLLHLRDLLLHRRLLRIVAATHAHTGLLREIVRLLRIVAAHGRLLRVVSSLGIGVVRLLGIVVALLT